MSIIKQGKESKNKDVKRYLEANQHLTHVIRLPSTLSKLYNIDQSVGILIGTKPNGIFWRMNPGVSQYPTTCEHVTFHAAMIARGKDKIYINPRIIYIYNQR